MFLKMREMEEVKLQLLFLRNHSRLAQKSIYGGETNQRIFREQIMESIRLIDEVIREVN